MVIKEGMEGFREGWILQFFFIPSLEERKSEINPWFKVEHCNSQTD